MISRLRESVRVFPSSPSALRLLPPPRALMGPPPLAPREDRPFPLRHEVGPGAPAPPSRCRCERPPAPQTPGSPGIAQRPAVPHKREGGHCGLQPCPARRQGKGRGRAAPPSHLPGRDPPAAPRFRPRRPRSVSNNVPERALRHIRGRGAGRREVAGLRRLAGTETGPDRGTVSAGRAPAPMASVRERWVGGSLFTSGTGAPQPAAPRWRVPVMGRQGLRRGAVRGRARRTEPPGVCVGSRGARRGGLDLVWGSQASPLLPFRCLLWQAVRA